MSQRDGMQAFHKHLAAAFDEKIAADTRRSRPHRALLNLVGLVLVTPILAIACAVTLGLTFPPGELALNHCERIVEDHATFYPDQSVEGMQWVPGFRCTMSGPTSEVVITETNWIAWVAHLAMVALSVVILWFALSRIPFTIVVGLGVAIYLFATLLVLEEGLSIRTLTGTFGIATGVVGIVLRWRRTQRSRPVVSVMQSGGSVPPVSVA